MKKIELLAPAGDLERLKTAVRYGADAVYVGGKQFSLRSRASNFDLEDIQKGVEFAKKHGANVHVTVNMLPHEDDLDGLKEYLIALEQAGVTAIIAASPAIIKCAKTYAPKLEVHVSTQHSTTNSAAANFWEQQGADRIVLARELTMEQIKQTQMHTKLPIEVFIHGGMCISYSGRCMLSNHMTMRDANRGGCAQSCRWKYRLYKDNTPIHDEQDLFSMSSKDLMAARMIPDLIDANVASLKIEGRMKSTYYIATLVHTYRMLIDEYYENGRILDKRMEWYCMELAKAENRPTGPGFYLGAPKAKDHLYGVNGAGVTGEFIAYVLDYDEKTKLATWEVRNRFQKGDEAEILAPHKEVRSFIINDIFDENRLLIDVANQPMRIVKVHTDVPMEQHAMIRKKMEKDRFDIY